MVGPDGRVVDCEPPSAKPVEKEKATKPMEQEKATKPSCTVTSGAYEQQLEAEAANPPPSEGVRPRRAAHGLAESGVEAETEAADPAPVARYRWAAH